jgi:prepilin-type N-terminal cleavage/methylation domain-containing protein
MPISRTPTRGFTLIEILCVVILIAIFAIVVIPQLNERGDIKAAAAARIVMADIMYAQNRAIAKQTAQYVKFDVASHTYQVQEGTPPTTVTHPVTLKTYTQTFNSTAIPDVTLTSAGFDGKDTLAFDEIGAPYAYDSAAGTQAALSTGTIKIAAGGYTMTLTVQPYTGEITTSTP